MAKRQKAWARRTRDLILARLGGKCTICGATTDLEFDVIRPTDSDHSQHGSHHRKMDWSHRMSFYKKMLTLDNLQLLCGKHNGAKQNKEDSETTPF